MSSDPWPKAAAPIGQVVTHVANGPRGIVLAVHAWVTWLGASTLVQVSWPKGALQLEWNHSKFAHGRHLLLGQARILLGFTLPVCNPRQAGRHSPRLRGTVPLGERP